MPNALSHDIHKLTARLDRAAEAMLQREEHISYSRYLALFAIQESSGTQRELARWLGTTEPSTSRMVAVLSAEKLLSVSTVRGAGNRRQLALTERGTELVGRCSRLLEGRFTELLQRSGVDYASYQRDTRRLLDQLDEDGQESQRYAL